MPRIVACLTLAITGLIARGVAADCCCECGCQAQCCKVCRCVPDIKKVPKITYSCECSDVCVPGPSKICGYKCECECVGECTCHAHTRAHKVPIWQPTCAKVAHRTKLVKHEEMKEVRSWKWVVEDLCPKCAANARNQKPGEEEALAADGAQGNERVEVADRRATGEPTPAPSSSRRLWTAFKRPIPPTVTE
jgi:hypothetical protein